jgi:membrane-bound lytic murein transglycosylase B
MQQGRLLRVSACALAILLVTFAVAAGSAAGSTGGTTAPSSAAGGTAPGTRTPSGATSPAGRTGGISPTAVRTPTKPVKPRKKRKRRRHAHAPAPPAAPAPAPPAPTAPAATGDIPSRYLALYKAAGESAGIDWRILAAIGKNESDHGRSTAAGVAEGLNFADCCAGPMQICTVTACGKTWQHYAVDADGDGIASVYDPDDAVYAAAALVRDLRAIVGSDPKLVLAAYNAGPGNVARYEGVPPFPETKAYVRAGLAYIASLR